MSGPIHRLPVESTLLASVAYDAARALLDLEFCGGYRYYFFDVPAECFQQLLQAPSKGVYFNRHIRNHFRYQSVAEVERQN